MDNQYNTRHVSTRQQSAGGLFSSPLPFALALLGGGAAIFCIWYFLYAGSHSGSNQPIPLIKAEGGPMKIRPDNASQPEVPHQDKLVYGRVNPAEQGKGVERLLPPTEEPMDMPEPQAVQSASADEGFPNPKASMENVSQFRTEPMENNAPTMESEKLTLTAEVEKQSDVSIEQLSGALTPPKKELEPQELPQQAPTAAVEPQPQPPQSKTLQSGYRVQLASMKSQDQAKQEWQRLQDEHKDVLNQLSANFTRVDLGANKGIFYRVQAGDFANKEEAQNVCNKLKSQNSNAGCLIVKF